MDTHAHTRTFIHIHTHRFFFFLLSHPFLSASPCLNGPYTQLLLINLPLNILTPLRRHTHTHTCTHTFTPLNILALPWYHWLLRYPACCSNAPGQPRWDHCCLKRRVKLCVFTCVCVRDENMLVPAPWGTTIQSTSSGSLNTLGMALQRGSIAAKGPQRDGGRERRGVDHHQGAQRENGEDGLIYEKVDKRLSV